MFSENGVIKKPPSETAYSIAYKLFLRQQIQGVFANILQNNAKYFLIRKQSCRVFGNAELTVVKVGVKAFSCQKFGMSTLLYQPAFVHNQY